ncbi:hypothetical protein O181_034990 [Austropuccinia psidii MF-1]|uniref:Uncharacterized protein n=1 Tax=Austropuccinia psidii MF-1 TaxID=1389203 RepID=A0A9Q3D627_9BASI|nr:hypothetical protein [Austropuccinia psidii MF-1]
MLPVLKVAGVVHIWYYIPLCTIFAQQFNGEPFRTQSHLSKSWWQNPSPILKEDFLTHQSGNPWQKSEDHSRIPITWPCRSWVGNSFRITPRAILLVCIWPNWANSYSTAGIQLHSLNFKMAQSVLTQLRQ